MFFKQLEHIQLQSEKGRERRREKILELERWWSEIKVLVSQHFKTWEASDRMRLCSNEIRCRPNQHCTVFIILLLIFLGVSVTQKLIEQYLS